MTAVEEIIVAAVGEEVREPMATVADRLREEGRREGQLAGELQGRVEGRRSLVAELLADRFGTLPEEVRSRLDAASLGELEQWAKRMFSAKTLAEVIGNG